MPAKARVSVGRGLVFGTNSRGSFANFDLDTHSWRTFQLCLLEGLETFSGRWPRSGTMRNGTAYLRRPLVRRIKEIASSLWHTRSHTEWPTPTADGGLLAKPSPALAERFHRKGRSGSFVEAVSGRIWPTPTADDANNVTQASGQYQSLTREVQMFPTPNARDWKDTPGMGTVRKDGRSKIDQLPRKVYQLEREKFATPRAEDAQCAGAHNGKADSLYSQVVKEKDETPGSLNPDWVEALMGFPTGWTELGSKESPESPAKSPIESPA